MLVKNIALNNWTGEKVDIEVCTETLTFEMYDYTFSLTDVKEYGRGEHPICQTTSFQLCGEGWEDPIQLLHVDKLDPSIEEMVTKAVQYIANHI